MRRPPPLLLDRCNDPAGRALRARVAHRDQLVVDDIGTDSAIGTVDPLVDLVHERLGHRRPITTFGRVQTRRSSSDIAGNGLRVAARQRGSRPERLGEVIRLQDLQDLLLRVHEIAVLLGTSTVLSNRHDHRGGPPQQGWLRWGIS